MTGYEPDNLVGLVGLLILALAVIIPAWLQHRKQDKKLASIQTQVVNSHGPDGKDRNLRDDIDRIIKAVEDTRTDIAEVRGELKGLTHRVDQLTR